MNNENMIVESSSNHNNSSLLVENKTNNNSSLIEKFYWVTPTSFDKVKPFNFKQAPWGITVIFVFSVVIIPTILSLLRAYVFFKLKSEIFLQVTDILFKLVPLIGFGFCMIISHKFMLKSGAWIAYSNCFVRIFIWIIVSLVKLTKSDTISWLNKIRIWLNNDVNSRIFSTLVLALVSFIAPLVLICTNQEVRKRIIYTFKENSMIIIWVVLYCFFFFNLLTLIINFLFRSNSNDATSLLSILTSKNQAEIDKLKTTSWGLFALFLLSCVVAPISEEFNCRFGMFTICRTPWLGFIASVFYFAAMHVMDYGDWDKIINYLPFSFISSLLYISTRGNIVYPVFFHWFSNFYIYIFGLV